MKHRSLCGIAAAFLAAATLLSPRAMAQAPKKEVKLEPAVLYTSRDGLPNVAGKLKAGGEVNVVFLGGSITVGGASPKGYVTFVTSWLKEQYPNAKINVLNKGISGTGSDFGAARYDRDVLAHNPDLVLIEFCVNDGDSDRTESMEKMVHKTWMKNPKTDLAIFYTMAQTHLESYKTGKLPPSASAHERVAAFYGIPSLGTVFNAAAKINAGEIPWSVFSGDGCHPTQAGYGFFDDVFAQALPELFKAAPTTHELGKSITPNLKVYEAPIVTKPLEFKGEFVTAKGEKAAKVYPLPIPSKNWSAQPVFTAADGKPIWRLSWMPKTLGGKFDPAFGADKTQWETNSMDWFEGGHCFAGPEGTALFAPYKDGSGLSISRHEIGIIRFIAPETGRYALSVKSGPWVSVPGDEKSMSFNVLKLAWDGKPGVSLAFQKEVRKDSKGLAIDLETKLLAGEELVFVPDTDHAFSTWGSLNILVGFLGP
ncbi:MAG: SGNH/GDSL hydrolase family protein [Verrucomicrobiota bacterium]